MSLMRTALRLITVEALTNATIAQKRVYDSFTGDLSTELSTESAKPVANVLTDKDEGDALSAQNGGPPFGRNIELSIELAMILAVRDGDETGILYPETDAQLEAALDFFEHQILQRLQVGDDASCILFRRIARITKYDCHRQVLDETGQKLAVRLLTLNCFCGDERIVKQNAGATPPTGLDVLPYPLREVAHLLPEGSAGLNICNAIAAAYGTLTLPQFGGMDVTYDGGNTTQGDVSSTEVQAEIDVEQQP